MVSQLYKMFHKFLLLKVNFCVISGFFPKLFNSIKLELVDISSFIKKNFKPKVFLEAFRKLLKRILTYFSNVLKEP